MLKRTVSRQEPGCCTMCANIASITYHFQKKEEKEDLFVHHARELNCAVSMLDVTLPAIYSTILREHNTKSFGGFQA